MPVLMDMGKWNRDNGRSSVPGIKMYYTNDDAVHKVIHYITRTRSNENKRNELVAIGGAGVSYNISVDQIVEQFLEVQNFYQIARRGGRRIIHETYSFSDDEFIKLNEDYALVNLIAREISAYFYKQGYQVVYAIHNDIQKHVHIHFAINTINFYTGKKFHSGGEDFKQRIQCFEMIFLRACDVADKKRTQLQSIRSPISFY